MTIRAFTVTAVDTTGVVIDGGVAHRLHGFALTEVNTAAGIVKFLSSAATSATTDPVATLSSPLLFQRTVASLGDIPFFYDEEGIYLPGGLALKISTGTAKVSGAIFLS